MNNPTDTKILLIEDNPGDRRLILEVLYEINALAQASAQYQLATADRLDRGMEALAAVQPDLILLDLSLPDSSGLATVVALVEAAPDISVIVLTGLDDEELAIKALQSGAQDYLVKSEISAGLLRRALPYAIERKRGEVRIERKARHLAALRSIDIAIAAGGDLVQTLAICVEHVISELGVAVASILAHNPDTQSLDYMVGRGPDPLIALQAHRQIGAGLAAQSVCEQRVAWANIQDGDITGLPASVGRCYMAVPLLAKGRVKGVVELIHAASAAEDPSWVAMLEALAGQTAIAIDNAELYEGLQRSNRDLANAYNATIEGWSRALDLRDRETEGHSQRVTNQTLKLARAAGIAEADLVHVWRGSLLHDIGKMGVPDQILLKPGPLTPEEWEIMHRHPQLAVDLLAPIAYLHPALDIPYCHHERWDGTGYPRGLKGEQIPLVARLFAVVDVWDALRSDRPYRAAWCEEKVRAHIQSLAGSHFDPAVVDLFLTVVDEG
ncbi:MAG: HD domain-containing phosphohydrolase [Chloroflexales bacterium]